jgi:hypothetical protein
MDIFGISIKKKSDKMKKVDSFIPPSNDDGSIVSTSSFYGVSLDLDGIVKDENDLIRRYRQVAEYPDCSNAIEEIVNEAISVTPDAQPVALNLNHIDSLSENVKKAFISEFTEILDLYDFSDKGYDTFRQWYIDGKAYFHAVVDTDNPKKGIQELRYVDPRKIRKVKEMIVEKDSHGNDIKKSGEQYYLFNDAGINANAKSGVKLSLESVFCATSGIVDYNTGMIRSHLHNSIKIVNSLKYTEESLVIYRVSRAPERRVFYIDVGNLNKAKADQYIQDTMARFRNKLVFNSTTGEINDNKQNQSMMEDYWLPRRDNSKTTEITTLPGGANLSALDDVNYFQNKLFRSLHVPITRLIPEQTFSIGRAGEITRDEIKFSKFITRLRSKFSRLFMEALRLQCVLKGIITYEDFSKIEKQIRFDFHDDNHFAELSESDVLQNRLSTLQVVDAYVGKYFDTSWVKKNVLKQSDEEIQEIQEKMDKEKPELEIEQPEEE